VAKETIVLITEISGKRYFWTRLFIARKESCVLFRFEFIAPTLLRKSIHGTRIE